MNRVLRSPEISDKPFVIPVHSSERLLAMAAEEETTDTSARDATVLSEAETAEMDEGQQDGDDTSSEDSGDTESIPGDSETETGDGDGKIEQVLDELTEEDGEIMIGLEEVAERDAAIAAARGDTPASTDEEDAPKEQAPASAREIEAMVEARLKEFEERFQQEKEDAYHSGFEDGTSEGTKHGLSQSEEEIARFQNVVETLSTQWKDTLRTYDTAVIDLSIRIARKIIDVEVEQNQDAILQAVHDCLAYVEDKTKVIIRVNPDDLEAVRRHRNDWLESLESMDHLLIEAEPTVTRGGCVVETPIGDVDAQIEERLERLRNALLEEINRNDDSQDA